MFKIISSVRPNRAGSAESSAKIGRAGSAEPSVKLAEPPSFKNTPFDEKKIVVLAKISFFIH